MAYGKAHEAVAQGTNIVGALSNSGEAAANRFNTLRSGKIKQFASGRLVSGQAIWLINIRKLKLKISAKPGEAINACR
jgi:glutamate synthase (NADPH/NADH) large chain